MPSKTKPTRPVWITGATIVGTITFISIVLALLNDALDLWDRLLYETSSAPVTSTQAAQSTEFVEGDGVLSVFPLFVGTTWEYSYGTRTDANQGENQTINEIGNYSVRVINRETLYEDQIRVFYMEISRPATNYGGIVFNSPCPLGGDLPITYMLVTDGKSIYQVCDRLSVLDIASKMISGEKITLSGPTFVLPLVEGALWDYYTDLPPRDDTAYQWYVESKLDVTVPAGTFRDCYKIIFRTNPDATLHFVCPGTGIVSSEYHHYGSIVDYSAELTSYNINYQTK